jgi:hypothetical protein
MADMIADGTSWVADQLKDHVSQSVTYRRGSQSVTVAATIGRTQYQVEQHDGSFLRVWTRDFIVQTADLVLGGLRVDPKRGDTIEETAGGRTYTYEVCAPTGNPPYEPADAFRAAVRIHTQETRISQ